MLEIIDNMAMGLLPAAKDAVHPIGNTCETLKFGTKLGEYHTELNIEDKKTINGPVFEVTDEQTHKVLISELDMLNFTCKVSPIEDLNSRYSARITDPQVELVNNKYAAAMAAKSIVKIRAKKKLVEGVIKEFVISDINYGDHE